MGEVVPGEYAPMVLGIYKHGRIVYLSEEDYRQMVCRAMGEHTAMDCEAAVNAGLEKPMEEEKEEKKLRRGTLLLKTWRLPVSRHLNCR